MSFRSKNIVRAKFPRVYEYEHPKTGRYFLVDARKLGKKERKTFQSKTLALKHAADVEEQFNKFGAQADVPKEKVVMADRFQGLTVQLAHFGKSPEDAVKHYVEHLGLEALRHVKPFIRDLVDQWEKYKKADQTVTKRYLNEVHCRVDVCGITAHGGAASSMGECGSFLWGVASQSLTRSWD